MNRGILSKSASKGSDPIRGSFPMDRFHECSEYVHSYLKCLETKEQLAQRCVPEMRQYMLCRYQKGLSSKEDIITARLPDEDYEPPEFDSQLFEEMLRKRNIHRMKHGS